MTAGTEGGLADQSTPGLYGYLAINKLLGSACFDRRLTPADREFLTVLSGYAGPDGTCCVKISSTLARRLGVSRQAVQKRARKPEECGYLMSERRFGPNGAEGAKSYRFNLDLQGADACPVVWDNALRGDTVSPLAATMVGGVQPSEVAPPRP